jgi:hypothetical protein
MTARTEAAALTRLMLALSPYRADIVLIGGWAHRLSRLHPLAQAPAFEPLATADVDLSIPGKMRPRGEDLRVLLVKAGFDERFFGEDRPPITRYVLGEEPGFYAEFLTPLVGRPKGPTRAIAGVTAQTLRYLDLLMIEPWSVFLEGPEYPVGRKALEVRIANATSYLAQKILVLGSRHAADRGKDALYMYDTLMTFGRSLTELQQIWTGHISSAVLPGARGALRRAIRRIFGDATDTVREASRIAKGAGRHVDPDELAQACRAGLERVFL